MKRFLLILLVVLLIPFFHIQNIEAARYRKLKKSFKTKELNIEKTVNANWDKINDTLTISGDGKINRENWVSLSKMFDEENAAIGNLFSWHRNNDFKLIIENGVKFPDNSSYFFNHFKGNIIIEDGIDTSNIKYMENMFANIENSHISIENWDVSNVESAKGVFYASKNLNPDISKWNLKSANIMDSIFNESGVREIYHINDEGQETFFDYKNTNGSYLLNVKNAEYIDIKAQEDCKYVKFFNLKKVDNNKLVEEKSYKTPEINGEFYELDKNNRYMVTSLKKSGRELEIIKGEEPCESDIRNSLEISEVLNKHIKKISLKEVEDHSDNKEIIAVLYKNGVTEEIEVPAKVYNKVIGPIKENEINDFDPTKYVKISFIADNDKISNFTEASYYVLKNTGVRITDLNLPNIDVGGNYKFIKWNFDYSKYINEDTIIRPIILKKVLKEDPIDRNNYYLITFIDKDRNEQVDKYWVLKGEKVGTIFPIDCVGEGRIYSGYEPIFDKDDIISKDITFNLLRSRDKKDNSSSIAKRLDDNDFSFFNFKNTNKESENFYSKNNFYEYKINKYEVKKVINGIEIIEKLDIAPLIVNNRTMIPIRHIAESLGIVVDWDNDEKSATFSKNTLTAKIKLNDENIYLSNGNIIKMDSKPIIINSRMLVSIKNLADVFNINENIDNNEKIEIVWNDKDRSLIVYKLKINMTK